MNEKYLEKNKQIKLIKDNVELIFNDCFSEIYDLIEEIDLSNESIDRLHFVLKKDMKHCIIYMVQYLIERGFKNETD